jgi:Tfp pilus assembly protein PilW
VSPCLCGPYGDQRGFTIVEFLIAAAITAAVLGGTIVLASQMQRVYSTQLDDTTAEEEVRFALDWIAQALRNAGSNPYSLGSLATSCAGTGTFAAITMNPDGASPTDDSIRIQADINPPNGLLGGLTASADCGNDNGEDITIAFDAGEMVITREDNSGSDGPVVMTEPVIADLEFVYLNSARAVTADADLVAYVRVRVTGRSQAYNTLLGENTERTLETEVRVRTR